MSQDFTAQGLAAAGFVGFTPFATLDCKTLPQEGGVYVVLRDSSVEPTFVSASPAGRFKGKDPTVEVSVLQNRWNTETDVIYIGKATSLRSRLRQYQDFGAGKPVGHWGGRYIWQLATTPELRVAWKLSDGVPRDEERALIADFIQTYGQMPFANLAR